MASSVITTNPARCRDCYRCVRTCSVKAIRVQDGQAQVVPELCITCGDCVRACPQGAKTVRDDRPEILQALKDGRKVVASVAPSAPAYFGMHVFSQIEDVLRSLGFAAADETAFGAEMVGQAHREYVERYQEAWPVITSSCPVVVSLIEKYHPDLLPHLAPIVSPMIAHGRWMRETYGADAYVVFIGPCIAKKGEIKDLPVEGIVDAALTFKELEEWMAEEGAGLPQIDVKQDIVPSATARLFPVEGGLVGTADMNTDMLTSHVVVASGLEACADVLNGIRSNKLEACLVELMACEGGCIHGPVMDDLEGGTYLARQRIIEYATRRQPKPLPRRNEWPSLARSYNDLHVPLPEFSEEQIQEVLHRVEKYSPDDELNCGACGYPTCREKAIATLRNMAEATMCIPYMRRRSESLRQVVMDVTPNAILIVDANLDIQDMSPSAEEMFNCRFSAVVGKPLQSIMPVVTDFERVRDTGKPIMGDTVQIRHDLIVEETMVRVPDQKLVVGILRDVTDREEQLDHFSHIRTETLQRTQEVINKQMRVAHEIAQLLGETTAETKMALSRLAQLLEEGNGK